MATSQPPPSARRSKPVKAIKICVGVCIAIFTFSFLYWLFFGGQPTATMTVITCVVVPVVLAFCCGFIYGRRGRPRIQVRFEDDEPEPAPQS